MRKFRTLTINAEKDIDEGVEHIREWYKDDFLYNLNRQVRGRGLSWISSFLEYKKGVCTNFAQMGAVLLSMTGFSFKEADTQQGILLLEFRSLNNRYLELQVKLDESLRTFEPMIRDVIS